MKTIIISLTIGFILGSCGSALSQEFHVGDTSDIHSQYYVLDDTLRLFPQGTVVYEFDIDQDHEPDIQFSIKHVVGQLSSHVWQMVTPLDSVEFICDTSDFNADTLLFMSLIKNEMNWIYNTQGVRLYEEFTSQSPPPWGPPSYQKGLFRKKGQYLGFRKISTNDTLYGWINLDCSVSEIAIKSFATKRNYSSITAYQSEQNLILFPNPASQFLTIITEHKGGIIMIYDLSGKLFFQQDYNLTKSTVDISDLPAGMYFTVIKTAKNRVARKLIKQ